MDISETLYYELLSFPVYKGEENEEKHAYYWSKVELKKEDQAECKFKLQVERDNFLLICNQEKCRTEYTLEVNIYKKLIGERVKNLFFYLAHETGLEGFEEFFIDSDPTLELEERLKDVLFR